MQQVCHGRAQTHPVSGVGVRQACPTPCMRPPGQLAAGIQHNPLLTCLTQCGWQPLAARQPHHEASAAFEDQLWALEASGQARQRSDEPRTTQQPWSSVQAELEAIQNSLEQEHGRLTMSRLSAYTFSLRELMLHVPVHIKQAGDHGAYLQPKLRKLAIISLTRVCRAFLGFGEGLPPAQVVLLLNTLHVARNLRWLRLADVNAATQQATSSSAPAAQPTRSKRRRDDSASLFALAPPPAVSTDRQAGWAAQLPVAAAELLPHLTAAAVRHIRSSHLAAPALVKLLKEMEALELALSDDDRTALLPIAQSLIISPSTPAEERVSLTVACARACGVHLVAGQLWTSLINALYRDTLNSDTPQLFNLSAAAQLVWLAAQVSLPPLVPSTPLGVAPSGAGTPPSSSAAADSWTEELLLLQGRRPHKAPQPFMDPAHYNDTTALSDSPSQYGHQWSADQCIVIKDLPTSATPGDLQKVFSKAGGIAHADVFIPSEGDAWNAFGFISFNSAAVAQHVLSQQCSKQFTVRRKRVAVEPYTSHQQHVIQHYVRAALQGRGNAPGEPPRLTHYGVLVSTWQPAGLPCTHDWTSLLIASATPVLERKQPSASQALCLAQLAQLPLLSAGSDHVPDSLNTWLETYIAKVVAGCAQLSDVQLHWVVRCLAATQRAYPYLSLLPSLDVPSWVNPSEQPSNRSTAPVAAATVERAEDVLRGVVQQSGHGIDQHELIDDEDDSDEQQQGDVVSGGAVRGWFEALRQHYQPAFKPARNRRGRKVTLQSAGPVQQHGGKHRLQQGQAPGHVLSLLADSHLPWGVFETVLVSLSMADVVGAEGRGAWSTAASSDTPGFEHELGSDSSVPQLAPYLPHYTAWQLLIQLHLRYATATAVGMVYSRHNLQMPGDASRAALLTSLAAHQLRDQHSASQLSGTAAQLHAQVSQQDTATQLCLLINSLASIPRVWRVLFSTNAAGALTIAIGRCSPDMNLPTLLTSLHYIKQLGIHPRSSTFRGNVQAQVARCIKKGQLRRPAGSKLVLNPVLKLIRVFHHVRMHLGPQLEETLTEELLAWHLNIGEEQQQVESERDTVVAAPRQGAQRNAGGGRSRQAASQQSQQAVGRDGRLQAECPAHALLLPCGCLLDKELSQMMKLMTRILFPGTSRLLDRLQCVAQRMIACGCLRPKYAVPYLSHMCKLGMVVTPQLLADLLTCALIEPSNRQPAATSLDDQQEPDLMLCYLHLNGAVTTLKQWLKYPVGSAAAKALSELHADLEMLERDRRAGRFHGAARVSVHQVLQRLAVLRQAPLVGAAVAPVGAGQGMAAAADGDVDDFIAKALSELKSENSMA